MMKKILLAGVFSLAFASSALSQGASISAIGPRVGISVNPDQVVLGGQLVMSGFAPRLTFDPSLELGFGDHVTVIAANFDLKYHFDIQGSNWSPYAGGGIGLNFWSVDQPPPFRDDSFNEVGANLFFGAGVPLQGGSRFFAEARAGVGDIPDLKLIVGWNFRM